ncbi:acyl carrier protein [Streptomyces sp. NBC_01565]|uniref:acyl carrier protein n=1 Tax=unclassified Streptomyces TaxID=2593676 RepID=UPI00225B07DE|nr:acyl carrier protein [Streptomyces sp. NBC_01565]MCX4546377.1 acyl carrier protein [Streptomyces sp. NBC_01565]
MSDMLRIVIDTLTQKAGLPAAPVTPTATLAQAGVDSMAIAVLAMILEDDHGIVITETDLSANSTLTELADFIEQHQTATT